MKANVLLIGLLMLVAGGAVFASSWLFSPLPNQSFGSDTMPRFVGLLGLGVGAALVYRSIAQGQRFPGATVQDWARDPRRLGGLTGVILAVVCYVLFADALGFVPIAALILLGLMLMGRTRPLVALIVAVAAAVVLQQIFGRLLLVPLPRSDLAVFFQ